MRRVLARVGLPRSVGGRLSLALLLLVAGALAIVYLVVVPSLERRLVDARLGELERAAPTVARELIEAPFDPNVVDEAAAATGARVVIYRALTVEPRTLAVVGDSRAGISSIDVEDDPVAQRASTKLALVRGTVERGDASFAEVAVPISTDGDVLLLSASLRDALGSVRHVERRLVLAGVLALLAAALVGYGAAHLFARRIRRLERAAERIAGGRFDEPVADPARDELGELAQAFERMRERLARLDHARREFIANASHELRTPLFSLGGFLELLADEELDEPTRRDFLVTMREQVERLTKLAGELLDLSRLDAGRLEVERVPVDLARVARLLGDEFAAAAHASGHRLAIDAGPAVPALADEQRVLQIGRNLVDNALAHTPPGTAVRISAAGLDGRALLAVEDEGPGIPPEHAPHVFERFYRVEGARASGSGLGLAIARELARLMGGSLELETEPGRTRVAVALPASDRFHGKTEDRMPIHLRLRDGG